MAIAVAALPVYSLIIPSEYLDTYARVTHASLVVVGTDGTELWSMEFMFPLAASDQLGKCIAIVDRPFIYQVFSQVVTAKITTEVTGPQGERIPVEYEIPVDLVLDVAVEKEALASLFTWDGYPLWAVKLPGVNATAVGTNCVDVLVGTMDGRLLVLRDGDVVGEFSLGAPITRISFTYDGRSALVGTEYGSVYLYDGGLSGPILSGRGTVVFTGFSKGEPVVAWLRKGDVPVAEVSGIGEVAFSSVVTYGVMVPRVPLAVSQDGSTVVMAKSYEVLVYRGDGLAYRLPSPSLPTAVSTNWNGSIVAVGTVDGYVVIYSNGVEAVRASVGGPVIDLALSADGLRAVAETPRDASLISLALVKVSVSMPDVCGEVATLRIGNYVYSILGEGVVLVPVGDVEIVAEPVYVSRDVRCTPLPASTSLRVAGSSLADPAATFEYRVEYRVDVAPPNVTLASALWVPAGGFVYLSARAEVEVGALGPVDRGRMVFHHWNVNGRNYTFPSIRVKAEAPIVARAYYTARVDEVVQLSDTVRLVLDSVDVLDADTGALVASGPTPVFSHFPVVLRPVYHREFLVRVALPNTTLSVWVREGDTVRVVAGEDAMGVYGDTVRIPTVIDYGNGTRDVFVGWAGGETLSLEVTRPLELRPQYRRMYLVSVVPPARIVGVEGNSTWAYRGSRLKIEIPQVVSQRGDVREVFVEWEGVEGRSPTITITVEGPLEVRYRTKTQYFTRFVSRYGMPTPREGWFDKGQDIAATVTPSYVFDPFPPIAYRFVGWRVEGAVGGVPLTAPPAAPTTYEAVWELDVVPLLVVGGLAAAIAATLLVVRRRRRAAEEIGEFE